MIRMRMLLLLTVLAIIISAVPLIKQTSYYHITSDISGLALDSKGLHLAIASVNSGGKVLDLSTGIVTNVFQGAAEAVSFLSNKFAFITNGGRVYISDVNGYVLSSKQLPGGIHDFDSSIALAPGQLVVSGTIVVSSGNTLTVTPVFMACRYKCGLFDIYGNLKWEVDVGDVEANPAHYKDYWYAADYMWNKVLIIKGGSIVNNLAYTERPYVTAVCGNRLAVGTEHHVYLYDISDPSSPKLLWKKNVNDARALAFISNCNYIAVSDNEAYPYGYEKKVLILNTENGNKVMELNYGNTAQQRVVALASNGKELAVGLADGSIYIYDVSGTSPSEIKAKLDYLGSILQKNKDIILKRLENKALLLKTLYERYFNYNWYENMWNTDIAEINTRIEEHYEFAAKQFTFDNTYAYLGAMKDIILAGLNLKDRIVDPVNVVKSIAALLMIDEEVQMFYKVASITDLSALFAAVIDGINCYSPSFENPFSKVLASDDCMKVWAKKIDNIFNSDLSIDDIRSIVNYYAGRRYRNLRFIVYGMLKAVEKEIDALKNGDIKDFLRYLEIEKAFADVGVNMYNSDIYNIDEQISYELVHEEAIKKGNYPLGMLYMTVFRKGLVLFYDLLSLSEQLDYPLLKIIDENVKITVPKLKLSDDKYWYTLVVKYGIFEKNGRKYLDLWFSAPLGYAYWSYNKECQIVVVLRCEKPIQLFGTTLYTFEKRKIICIEIPNANEITPKTTYVVDNIDVTKYLEDCNELKMAVHASEPLLINEGYTALLSNTMYPFRKFFNDYFGWLTYLLFHRKVPDSVYDLYLTAEIMEVNLKNLKLNKLYVYNDEYKPINSIMPEYTETSSSEKVLTKTSIFSTTYRVCNTSTITKTETVPITKTLTTTITKVLESTRVVTTTRTIYETKTHTSTRVITTKLTKVYTTTEYVYNTPTTVTRTITIPTTITKTLTTTYLLPTTIIEVLTNTTRITTTIVSTMADTLITTSIRVVTSTDTTTVTNTELIVFGKKIPGVTLLAPIVLAAVLGRKRKKRF